MDKNLANTEKEDLSVVNVSKPKKKLTPVKFLIGFFSIFIAITIIACAAIYFMITDKTNADKYGYTPSTDILEPLVGSVALGKEAKITDKMVNELLALGLKNINSESTSSNSTFKIKDIAINFHENDECDIYFNLNYAGIDMIASAKAKIKLNTENSTINFNCTETKIGSLSVPPEYTVKYILAHKDIEKYITALDSGKVGNTDITCTSKYETSINSHKFMIELTKIDTNEGSATVQTNNLVSQFGNYLEKIFSDTLS